MNKLCMCGSDDVRIRSEKDFDGFGYFIWAECGNCGLKSRSKFVSERCPQSNQECFDDFNQIIKPFKDLQKRIAKLESQVKEREQWVDRIYVHGKAVVERCGKQDKDNHWIYPTISNFNRVLKEVPTTQPPKEQDHE